MRVPLSWLREFVPVPEDPAALIDRLAMLGFGHEPVEWVGEEAVLDLEVASNRPDLLSVLGVAREVAAAWEREVTPPVFMLRRSTSRAGAAADVAVEDPEGAPATPRTSSPACAWGPPRTGWSGAWRRPASAVSTTSWM